MSSPRPGEPPLRVARIVVGLVLAIAFFWLLFREVDLAGAWRAATTLGVATLAVALALVAGAYTLRALRWWRLLAGTGMTVGFGAAAWLFVTSFGLNNVLPLRAGDVFRCIVAAALPTGSMSAALATLLVERLLDLGILLVLLLFALQAFPIPGLAPLLDPISGLLSLAVVVFLATVAFPSAMRRIVDAGLRRLALDPEGKAFAIGRWLRSFASAIESCLAGRQRAPVVALTATAWALEIGVFITIGSALTQTPVLAGGLYGGTLGTLSGLLPGAPGHFGAYDYFAAQGFQAGGLDAETAVAAALLTHLTIWAPVSLLAAARLLRPVGQNFVRHPPRPDDPQPDKTRMPTC